MLATKAHHTEAATRALLPHLSRTGCVISVQNGLNELTIAEIVGPERTVGAFVNFGADYLEPGVILHGSRAAVVVGEIDGRITPRVTAIRDAWRDFDDRAIVTPNIWGFLWGKEAYGAMLFATALTNESIADALAMPAYRHVYIALAREILAVAKARGITPGVVRRLRSRPPTCRTPHAAPRRTLARRSRRPQPPLGQDAQRHLARPRRAQAAHRSRRAARHRRDASESRPASPRRSPTVLVELIHEIENGERARSPWPRSTRWPRPCRCLRHPDLRSRQVNTRLQRQDRHRHRRRARIRPRDQPGLRAARRERVGLRRARDRAARDAAALHRGGRRLHRAHRRRARQARRRALRRRRLRGRTGRVDILVNNAGGVLGQVGRPLEEVTPEAMAGHLRRQRHRRLLLLAGRRARHEGRARRPHRQHLERRRARHQPHGHPGVRVREGGADRPHAPARARARAVGHHGQQHRAGIRALQPDHRAAVGIVRRRGAAAR